LVDIGFTERANEICRREREGTSSRYFADAAKTAVPTGSMSSAHG
jgi:hypothetical protein